MKRQKNPETNAVSKVSCETAPDHQHYAHVHVGQSVTHLHTKRSAKPPLSPSPEPSTVSMTNLTDLEVRRNKLLWCFSNLILLPTDFSPRLIKSSKSCPCGIRVLSNSTVSLSEKIDRDWLWHRDCARVLHVHNRSVLILTIAQQLACLSKHDPNVLLRGIHDNLHVVRSS